MVLRFLTLVYGNIVFNSYTFCFQEQFMPQKLRHNWGLSHGSHSSSVLENKNLPELCKQVDYLC